MPDVKLKVVPKPAENTRILAISVSENSTLLFKGKSADDLRCGQCGAVLAEKVDERQFCSLIFLCCSCDSYNETVKT